MKYAWDSEINQVNGEAEICGGSTRLKSTLAGSEYIKNIKFVPYVVTEDETFSLICESIVTDIQSIIIYLNYYAFSIKDSPIDPDSIVLLDNGDNGDIQANDNIFTVNNLIYNDLNLYFDTLGRVVHHTWLTYMDIKYIFDDGSSFLENIDLGIGIRFFNSKIVPIPDVEVINENIQYSSHVVNIVMEEN
jgi:hypothetical protein